MRLGERLTDSHNHTPEDYGSNNVDGWALSEKGLGDGSNDDEDQLDTVHLLSAEDISEGSEAELSNDGSGRGGHLDGGVLRSSEFAGVAVLVHNTQHDGQERGSEDVVLIREETDTGDNTGAHMVPSERRLVDLREGQPTTLVGVLDVSEVVVEVVEGSISTAGRAVSLGSDVEGGHCIGGCDCRVICAGGILRREAGRREHTMLYIHSRVHGW